MTLPRKRRLSVRDLNASKSESMPEWDDLLRHAVRGYEEAPLAPETGTPLKRQPDVVISLRAGINPWQTTRTSAPIDPAFLSQIQTRAIALDKPTFYFHTVTFLSRTEEIVVLSKRGTDRTDRSWRMLMIG
jgi:hypothetical protein